jgi:hypothetical protein
MNKQAKEKRYCGVLPVRNTDTEHQSATIGHCSKMCVHPHLNKLMSNELSCGFESARWGDMMA